MRKNPVKLNNLITSMSCFSLILLSNNSELAAEFLPIKEKFPEKGNIFQKNDINKKSFSTKSDIHNSNSLLLANNGQQVEEESV